MKLNYIIIPLVAFLTAGIGSWITNGGMDWYRTINLPAFTPPGYIIGIAWTIIFILSAISALLVWNRFPRDKRFKWIIELFIINAFLNVSWSCFFFSFHFLGWAVFGAAFLFISVILLIFLIRPLLRLAAILLYPYAIWTAFATYLTCVIFKLN